MCRKQWRKAENMRDNQSKIHGLALDLVEEGQDLSLWEQKVQKKKAPLPQGVTNKMMYADVIRIAWPSMVELLLTQLASMIDLMMVGQLGAWALTSVGLTTQPKFLFMTIFQALNVGATAMVARSKGAGRQDKANLIMRQALMMTFLVAIAMSFIGYFSSEWMVKFMGASDAESLAGGTIYLQIQMIGFVPMALTTVITAVLRGVGDSRTAMIYNVVANVVNVILNYFLIYGHMGFPALGIAGASLATILGQAVAMVMAFYAVMRHRSGYLHLRLTDGFLPDKESIASIFKIGFPAMVEQLVMRAGMIIYSKTVASLGTVAFATHQVCMNIQALSFMNGQAFGVSATSLVGQCLGKRRPDMAEQYSRRTRRVGMMVSLFLATCFVLFSHQIVALYNNDPEIVSLGGTILMFIAFIQPFQASQFILAGVLRGAGDTRATAVITFMTVLLVRPGLAILMIYGFHLGLPGAWVALAADQLLRSLLVWIRYRTGKWKTIKV